LLSDLDSDLYSDLLSPEEELEDSELDELDSELPPPEGASPDVVVVGAELAALDAAALAAELAADEAALLAAELTAAPTADETAFAVIVVVVCAA
jgi:hypothetical protein